MTAFVSLESSGDDPEFCPLYVQPGGSGTVVTVVSGDTVSYWTAIDDNASAAGTIALNASQTFTTEPVWLTSNSVSEVSISGPGY